MALDLVDLRRRIDSRLFISPREILTLIKVIEQVEELHHFDVDAILNGATVPPVGSEEVDFFRFHPGDNQPSLFREYMIKPVSDHVLALDCDVCGSYCDCEG